MMYMHILEKLLFILFIKYNLVKKLINYVYILCESNNSSVIYLWLTICFMSRT